MNATYIAPEQRTVLLGCVNNPEVRMVMIDGHIIEPAWARSWDDLQPVERKLLSELESIDTLELVDKWTDDHVTCWGLRINGIGLGFWWYDDYLGREASMEDKESVLEYLKDRIHQEELQ